MSLMSEAKTLLNLAGDYFGARKSLTAITARATITYAKFGQQTDQWAALLDAGKSVEIPVRDLLNKLQNATTQLAKSSFAALSVEVEPLLHRSNELENIAEDIFKASQQSQDEALKNLKSAWHAKDPNSQKSVDHLKKAEAICSSAAVELDKQIKTRETVNLQLEDVAYRTYLALPDKKDLPRSAYTPSMRQKLGGSSQT